MKVLSYRPESLDALRSEYEQNLSHKRTFVHGAEGVEERERCRLEVVHPDSGAVFGIEGEAVYVQPGVGIGLDLHELDAEAQAELSRFIEGESDQEEPGGDDDDQAGNIFDRVRALGTRERENLARQGNIAERTALERCFKGAIWEGLLQNPQITPAEVARIAKNPSLPTALMAAVVGNPGWLSRPEVQRALMTNPRLSGVQLDKVIKALPRSELAVFAQNPSVRQQVRSAVKKLLG